MEAQHEASAWEEIGALPVRRQAVATQPSGQRSLQCRISDITDIDPSSPAEIIGELTPVLALVAPSGMDGDARRVWFNAAVKALEGIPIRLLQRGAQAAIAKADHPSKIIPTIMKEIADDWNWRKRMAPTRKVEAEAAPVVVDEAERAEVASMMSELAAKLRMGVAGDGFRGGANLEGR